MRRKNLSAFDDDSKSYTLTKFSRTNQNTCVNLRPIVRKGDKVNKGQVLCEGYATKDGSLALRPEPDGRLHAMERL